MLVDLGRNDLSRVCMPGTVKVERFLEPERFSHVTHLVSEVAGELQDGVTPFDLLRATFPAGTVSRRAEGARDADHLRARGLPARHVRGRRRLPPAGRRRSTRASRSAPSSSSDGVAYLQAGGGSSPTRTRRPSTEECLNKLAALEAAIELAEGRCVILLIDNYDSFTYNLAHLFGELGAEVVVRRNDEITPDEAEALAPSHLVVSPGPGRPEDAGVDAGDPPAALPTGCRSLGVCLGHQAIVQVFGGEVGQARELVHGKATLVAHDGRGLFAGLPEDFLAGRYHSLAATSVPDVLRGLGDRAPTAR